MPADDSTQSVLAALDELLAEIDQQAARIAARHGARLRCGRGCAACCLDDLTVNAVEAESIRRRYSELLERAAPHPTGACAFLDGQGACRIYRDRPAVCRTQGLPLRVLFEDEDDEIAERRDICPLNLEGGPALDELAEDDCWLIGPVELQLAELTRRLCGDAAPRTALRDLFRNSAHPAD
jgi:Fe-S-cluster containining protein